MTGIKTPAEMRELAEAALHDPKDDGFSFERAANPSQLTAMCDLIEAQARRIEELEAALPEALRLGAIQRNIDDAWDDERGEHVAEFDSIHAKCAALLSTPGAS